MNIPINELEPSFIAKVCEDTHHPESHFCEALGVTRSTQKIGNFEIMAMISLLEEFRPPALMAVQINLKKRHPLI